VVTGKKKESRTFFAFVQEWEEEAKRNKGPQFEVLLRRKYGGMKYYNVDEDKGKFLPRTIDINRLLWSNKKDDRGYKLLGLKEELEENHPDRTEEWDIGEDIHFIIAVYYRKNPDPSIKIVSSNEYGGRAVDDSLIDEWLNNGGWFNNQIARACHRRARTPRGNTRGIRNHPRKKKFKKTQNDDSDSDESKSDDGNEESDSDETVGE
jgi:hypothetical protein